MAPPLHTGTCNAHGKLLYRSRKVARRYARRVHPGGGLSAYECEVWPGLWHLGHLPDEVVAGRMGREVAFTRRLDVPTAPPD